MSSHQYLIQQRVERAKYLLKRSQLTITAIAVECDFAKYFRKHRGMNPQKFCQ